MRFPPVVTPAEWQAARDELLVQEKEATRALDALAARRRRLPMVRSPHPDGLRPYRRWKEQTLP